MRLSITDVVDLLLKISLLVALGCSIFIFVQALIFKNSEYRERLMSWQMPMIFALVTDLYLSN
jgi:hypothetical protein